MGKHTVGSLVQTQIKASGFDTKELKISGTSLRKNMFDAMVESDVPDVLMSAHGGHKSTKSKESYVSKTSTAKKAINKILSDSLKGEESGKFYDIVNNEKKIEKEKIKEIVSRKVHSDDKENLPPASKRYCQDTVKHDVSGDKLSLDVHIQSPLSLASQYQQPYMQTPLPYNCPSTSIYEPQQMLQPSPLYQSHGQTTPSYQSQLLQNPPYPLTSYSYQPQQIAMSPPYQPQQLQMSLPKLPQQIQMNLPNQPQQLEISFPNQPKQLQMSLPNQSQQLHMILPNQSQQYQMSSPNQPQQINQSQQIQMSSPNQPQQINQSRQLQINPPNWSQQIQAPPYQLLESPHIQSRQLQINPTTQSHHVQISSPYQSPQFQCPPIQPPQFQCPPIQPHKLQMSPPYEPPYQSQQLLSSSPYQLQQVQTIPQYQSPQSLLYSYPQASQLYQPSSSHTISPPQFVPPTISPYSHSHLAPTQASQFPVGQQHRPGTQYPPDPVQGLPSGTMRTLTTEQRYMGDGNGNYQAMRMQSMFYGGVNNQVFLEIIITRIFYTNSTIIVF